jgi:cysteinyl-tRNA synthetase
VIRLYNSLTRNIEEFVPGDPKNVTMYVCGPTVYDTPHLGNARPAVVFDILSNLLRHEYGVGAVNYASNYTDIDDKIIDKAKQTGVSIEQITIRTISQYQTIMHALGNHEPNFRPTATGHIGPMIDMIAKLIGSGHAYLSEGHVLFDIASWSAHGVLSGHKQEDLESGQHRVALADYKKAAGDFVLWKPSTGDQPGWESPWGVGRPGWHIECSAMIGEVFDNQTIDIHGGGADLRFPHHECEISQFEACNHVPLARFWVHNAMVTVNGKKMSKSEGNFVTVDEVIAKGIPEQAIRLALMGTQYRSPLDWTDELINQSTQTLTSWHRALELVDASPEYNVFAQMILEPLSSDLNIPLAITRIHGLMTNIADDAETIGAGVRFAGSILGLDLVNNDQYLRGYDNRADIETLVADRIAARQRRDWKESDRLRGVLNDMGLAVEDGPTGTSWRRA